MSALNPHDLTNQLMAVANYGANSQNHFHLVGNADGGGCALGPDWKLNNQVAHRLVACWNACLGMADPGVEVARLRAGELSAHLGDGVAALLPDHPDAAHPGPWHVVDCSGEPSMVMTVDGRWALYPDSEAQEFTDLDQACDIALGHDGDVVPVVRVG